MQSLPTNFWQWLATTRSDEREMLIVFGAVALIAIVAIAAKTIQRIHRTRLEDTLKRELVERGFSAEEVIAIVQASAAPQGRRSNARHRKSSREANHVYAQ